MSSPHQKLPGVPEHSKGGHCPEARHASALTLSTLKAHLSRSVPSLRSGDYISLHSSRSSSLCQCYNLGRSLTPISRVVSQCVPDVVLLFLIKGISGAFWRSNPGQPGAQKSWALQERSEGGLMGGRAHSRNAPAHPSHSKLSTTRSCTRLLAHASRAFGAETLSRQVHFANISTLSRLIQNSSLCMKTRKRCSLLAPERENSCPYGPHCMAFCLGVGNWLMQERHACAHLLLHAAPLQRAGRMRVNTWGD